MKSSVREREGVKSKNLVSCKIGVSPSNQLHVGVQVHVHTNRSGRVKSE